MPHPFEHTLATRFLQVTKIYIQTFPRAHIAGGFDAWDAGQNLQAYKAAIQDTYLAARRVAADELNAYLNLYGVRASFSADEFKLIYFMGRAITYQLRNIGYHEIAQVHQIAMLGMLDYRLRTLEISKKQMLNAMATLVRSEKFDSELGKTGCYLAYKCVSTTAKDDAM